MKLQAVSFNSMNYTRRILLFLFFIFAFMQFRYASSFEYQVGGSRGWTVPPSNESNFYNEWASENRFIVNNTISFMYKKDSVMRVTFADYMNCNSNHPEFFSNTGNTVFRLDHPGPFYFISGVSGHCEKGQKVIIKAVSHDEDEHSHMHSKSSGDSTNAAVLSFGVFNLTLLYIILYYVSAFIY